MGFSWAGATAGLLGAVSEEADKYGARKAQQQQQQMERELADRKERAAFAKEMAMEKWKMMVEDRKDQRQSAQFEQQDKRQAAQFDHQSSLLDARLSAKGSGGGGGKGDSESTLEAKMRIAKEKVDSGEWTAAEGKKFVGANVGGDGGDGMKEADKLKIYDKIDEITAGGITDENLPSLNRYLAAVGEPPYKKSITKPKKEGGIMGWGGQEEESEFKQDVSINKIDSPGLQKETPGDTVKGSGANKFSAMLTTKTEGQPAKVDGTTINLNDDVPKKKSPPGGSTDVGTELGEAVEIIVAGGEVTVDMVKAMPGLAEALVDASTRAEGATAKKLIAAAKKAEGFLKNMVKPETMTGKEGRVQEAAYIPLGYRRIGKE